MTRSISVLAVALGGMLALSGCTGMTDTQQRTLTGGLGGAAAGGVIGAIAGNTALGVAIGAGAGMAGGYLFDQHKQAEQRAYQRGVATGRSQAAPAPQSNPSN